MVRSILKYAVCGFFLGMAIGVAIVIAESLIDGKGMIVFSGTLLEKGGSPAGALALQTLFSGLHGAICMAGVYLYELDNWSMTRVVITHYLIIMASFLLIGGFLGWYTMSAGSAAMIALLMAIGYFIVWIIMYLRYSVEVRALNDLISKEQEE